MYSHYTYLYFFFFNDTATTEIYTLSLHDALPILSHRVCRHEAVVVPDRRIFAHDRGGVLDRDFVRSEEHTSELQSHSDLVCRLLLEKKKQLSATPIRVPKVRYSQCRTSLTYAFH